MIRSWFLRLPKEAATPLSCMCKCFQRASVKGWMNSRDMAFIGSDRSPRYDCFLICDVEIEWCLLFVFACRSAVSRVENETWILL